MNYINYPLSVILNVENNPYAQGSLPNIASPDVQAYALNSAMARLRKISTQQKNLYQTIKKELGISGEINFSQGQAKQTTSKLDSQQIEQINQENQNFAKIFQQLLAILATARKKDDRREALNKLIALTSNQIQTLENNETVIKTIANEMMLLRRNIWINSKVQKGQDKDTSKEEYDKKKRKQVLKAARKELEEYLQYLKNNQKKEQEELDEDQLSQMVTQELTVTPNKYLDFNFVSSRAGFTFEALINQSKIQYLQKLIPSGSGWKVTGSTVPNEIRYQYFLNEEEGQLQKRSKPVLDKIDEYIVVTKTETSDQSNKNANSYAFAFSDKLYTDISRIQPISSTTLLNSLDIFEQISQSATMKNFIFLALNASQASAFHNNLDSESLNSFIKKLFTSFVYEAAFNPANFATKILSDMESNNILYLTHFGAQVIPSYQILDQTIDQMISLSTNPSPVIKTSFTPDKTSAYEYYDQIKANKNYKDGKHFNELAWNYIAYQVEQNTKISMTLNAQRLNFLLFGS